MTIQHANTIQVALKRQSALGTAASGASAIGLNVVPGQGLRLIKNTFQSEAIRRDGQTTRGRHGSRRGETSYGLEIGVGMADDLLEAVLRGTFTAATDVTEATMTSITTTTSTIVAAAGSWLTQGVRRGDKVKLTGHSTSANNAKWFRVVAVTASTITVAGTPLTANAVADTAFTLTIAKRLLNGASPTNIYYTIEEFGNDIAAGLLGTDFKCNRFELSIQPDRNIMATFGFIGIDVAKETSANFSSPVYSTALPLVMVDGTIRIGGVDYSVLTGFTLTWDLGGSVPATLSSTSPDAFVSNGRLSGSFTAMRADMVFFDAFRAETQVELFIDMAENESDPKDFISLYVGNATLGANDASLGADGPLIETVPWMAGIDEAGGDRASTTLKIATSAA